MTSTQLGNGRWESTVFNSRLQPTQIALGASVGDTGLLKLAYSYGDWNGSSIDVTKNNGNIVQQVITVPTVGSSAGFTATQKYYYDSLNRIDDSTETISSTQTWRQDFTYDRYGNRNFNETNTTMPASFANPAVTNPTISTSNNRITSTGYSYDSSGNTTNDPSGKVFVYDAENKQVKAADTTGTIGEYCYDGDGKRVKKYVPSTGEVTVFVYDASGKSIAEYSTIVANSTDAKVNYLTADHLGSPRINTDANGAVTARHDYHPFGEEIATSQRTPGLGYQPDTVRKQFTGYERDAEAELEFAQARYYNKHLGRFTSADNPLADQFESIPQSWSLYPYARNNPLNISDSSGRAAECPPGAPAGCYEKDGQFYFKLEDGTESIWDPVPEIINIREKLSGEGIGLSTLAPCSVTPGGCGNVDADPGILPIPMGGVVDKAVGSIVTRILRWFGIGGGAISKKVIPKFVLSSVWKRNWPAYMAKRGWTTDMIKEAVETGSRVAHVPPGGNFLNPGNPMSLVTHPTTGLKLVIDDVTHEIIQLGAKDHLW